MKQIFICLIALTATIAISQADDASNLKSMKMKITEPWKDVTIKLVVAGSSGSSATKTKTKEIQAKRAVYEITPNPINGREEYSMLLIHDPYSKKQIFIDGEYSFYLSDASGMKGFFVASGVIMWASSYLELSDTNQNEAAIAQLEKSFDTQKLKQEQEKRLTFNRIGLSQVLSRWYFSMSPAPGGGIVDPQVEAINLTDGILRLDIRNPATKIPASLWIDLKAKRVIKSVVDGEEMDISAVGTQKNYAVPLKKE
jgi:hypothetical protein